MLYLPNDKMWTNKFTFVQLPTKAQIFSRTGQRAVSPAGSYSGDSSVRIGKTPTMSAAEFLKDVDIFETPKDESK